jgi:MFS family permease
MIYAGLIGALTAIFALGFALLPSVIQTSYVYGIVFVLLGIAEAGVRLGRKTYLLDYLDEKDRPTYIAFANSSIGVVTLGIGALLGLVIQYFGIQILLYVLIGMGLVGSYLSLRLKSSE